MNETPDDDRAGRPADDSRSPAERSEMRIEGHLIKKLPKEEGVCPPHVEFFTEDSPDGFRDDSPRFVAFCPDCGSKLTLEQHEDCPFFGGRETDGKGLVVAVHCGLPAAERPSASKDPRTKPSE